MAQFSDLVGKTITQITGTQGDEELRFFTSDGKEYLMYHSQDCCESVSLEDVAGNLSDLLDSPILQADEESNNDPIEGRECSESFTWTFYRIATAKGLVVLRWLGESNGYYSESVDFTEV